MNRVKFFNALRTRSSVLFGSSLTTPQVMGVDALLDAGKDLPLHHMANVLVNVHRETGGGMYPVKETVMPHHNDKLPSDAEVKRRLEAAWSSGQLQRAGVKTPYWRDGAFGRGQIQITHEKNYAKFGITNYSDALKRDVSARIAVKGMRDGMFTGKKLSDYDFPSALNNPPRTNPRRIVNGPDGNDDKIRAMHFAFVWALEAGGWGETENWMSRLINTIMGFFKGVQT